mgnify:CR=1 FL=1
MCFVPVRVRRIDGAERSRAKLCMPAIFAFRAWLTRKVLRSPLPHARIRRIDSSKAAALPGVVAVVSRDNLNVASNSFGAYVKDQQILATDKVRYVGDMVAAVAAVDEAVAEEALEADRCGVRRTARGLHDRRGVEGQRSAGARELGRPERSALWAGRSSHHPR